MEYKSDALENRFKEIDQIAPSLNLSKKREMLYSRKFVFVTILSEFILKNVDHTCTKTIWMRFFHSTKLIFWREEEIAWIHMVFRWKKLKEWSFRRKEKNIRNYKTEERLFIPKPFQLNFFFSEYRTYVHFVLIFHWY